MSGCLRIFFFLYQEMSHTHQVMSDPLPMYVTACIRLICPSTSLIHECSFSTFQAVATEVNLYAGGPARQKSKANVIK